MTLEFKLPELGENIESGDVITILVAVGDTIKVDDPILELETDKATIEVPSAVSGVIKSILVNEGDTIQVGQVILTAQVEADGVIVSTPESTLTALAENVEQPQAVLAETVPTTPPQPKPPQTVPENKPTFPSQSPEPAPFVPAPAPHRHELPLRSERSMVPAAPQTRRLARQIGVDITLVPGSGPQGWVSRNDVKQHARVMRAKLFNTSSTTPVTTTERPAIALPDFSKWGEIQRQAMSNIRQATAKQMDRAWSTIPHVTQFDKADITDLEQLRKRFGPKVEAEGAKLTVTAILLKVVAAALKEFPQFNSSIDMVSHEVIYKQYYHIGVAVDTDRGLLVPVVRDVDRKNIIELAVELGDIATKARNRKLTLDDMRGGTFTITNLGGIGGTNFTPIINAPEVAILGVARGGYAPVFNKSNKEFEPRLMLPLSLSYDHRIIDGADGARFTRWIVEYLEQPFLTALQGW